MYNLKHINSIIFNTRIPRDGGAGGAGPEPNPNPDPGGDPNPDPNPNPDDDPESKEKKDPAYWEGKAKANAKEAQNLRTRLKDLEAKEKERTDAEKTELQKAQDKIKELETSSTAARQQALDARIAIRAQKLGFADPEDASKFLKREDLNDDEGNLDELLKAVLKAKPYLKVSAGGVPHTPGANPASGTATASAIDKAKVEKAKGNLPFLANRLRNRPKDE